MTTSTDRALPEGFEDFEPFLGWALPTQNGRQRKKSRSTIEELQALYDLGMKNDRISDALDHCDKFPLDDLPADTQRLFHILLSMAEIRPEVECWKTVTPLEACSSDRTPFLARLDHN